MDTTAPPKKKTCKMCCMEIPEAARKCPHCQTLQTRMAMLLSNPALPQLIFTVPFLVIIMLFFTKIFSRGEAFETYANQIAVTQTEIVFGDKKTGGTVAVMGTIKNMSAVSWKQIGFHVDFMDAAGRRVDVGEAEEYHVRLPAQTVSTFKVSFPREFPQDTYRKAAVRVVSAKDARSRL